MKYPVTAGPDEKGPALSPPNGNFLLSDIFYA